MCNGTADYTHTVRLIYRPTTLDYDQIDDTCLAATTHGYHHVLPFISKDTVHLLGQTTASTFHAATAIAIDAISQTGPTLGTPVALEVTTIDEDDRQEP